MKINEGEIRLGNGDGVSPLDMLSGDVCLLV